MSIGDEMLPPTLEMAILQTALPLNSVGDSEAEVNHKESNPGCRVC